MEPLDIDPRIAPWIFWRIFRFRRAVEPACVPNCQGCKHYTEACLGYRSFESLTHQFPG